MDLLESFFVSAQNTSFVILLFDYRKSDGDTKAAEMNKRKLSADLALTRAHISIKQRDGKIIQAKQEYTVKPV